MGGRKRKIKKFIMIPLLMFEKCYETKRTFFFISSFIYPQSIHPTKSNEISIKVCWCSKSNIIDETMMKKAVTFLFFVGQLQ